MNTAPELIQEVKRAVSAMPDHLDAMKDFISLISVLLADADLEGENPGLHRLVLVIGKHLDSVIERHFQAERAIHRLANP